MIKFKETLNTTQKTNNLKRSKTKLAWFSRPLRHSARKQDGIILQYFQANIIMAFYYYQQLLVCKQFKTQRAFRILHVVILALRMFQIVLICTCTTEQSGLFSTFGDWTYHLRASVLTSSAGNMSDKLKIRRKLLKRRHTEISSNKYGDHIIRDNTRCYV